MYKRNKLKVKLHHGRFLPSLVS